jgi:hypothetical protein
MVDWWKQWKPKNMPQECVFATDGYAVCPVCLNNDDIDHIGDESEESDGIQTSHWECENCGTLFSVYDEHPHYRKTWRKDSDHYDFYYNLADFEKSEIGSKSS